MAGPRGTPAVVGGKVYTFGITGVLACFEADSGKNVWQVDTIKDFVHLTDDVVLENSIFTKVGAAGALPATAFKAATDIDAAAKDTTPTRAAPVAPAGYHGRSADVVPHSSHEETVGNAGPGFHRSAICESPYSRGIPRTIR